LSYPPCVVVKLLKALRLRLRSTPTATAVFECIAAPISFVILVVAAVTNPCGTVNARRQFAGFEGFVNFLAERVPWA